MANHHSNGNFILCNYCGKEYAFYSYNEAKNDHFVPRTWRVAATSDFLAIQKTLEDNGVVPGISTAKAFYPDSKGGVLGFHHLNLGYLDIVRFEYLDFLERGQTGYYGCLKYVEKQDEWIPGLVSITANEGFKVKEDWYWSTDQYDEFYTVRLVQDINQ